MWSEQQQEEQQENEDSLQQRFGIETQASNLLSEAMSVALTDLEAIDQLLLPDDIRYKHYKYCTLCVFFACYCIMFSHTVVRNEETDNKSHGLSNTQF